MAFSGLWHPPLRGFVVRTHQDAEQAIHRTGGQHGGEALVAQRLHYALGVKPRQRGDLQVRGTGFRSGNGGNRRSGPDGFHLFLGGGAAGRPVRCPEPGGLRYRRRAARADPVRERWCSRRRFPWAVRLPALRVGRGGGPARVATRVAAHVAGESRPGGVPANHVTHGEEHSAECHHHKKKTDELPVANHQFFVAAGLRHVCDLPASLLVSGTEDSAFRITLRASLRSVCYGAPGLPWRTGTGDKGEGSGLASARPGWMPARAAFGNRSATPPPASIAMPPSRLAVPRQHGAPLRARKERRTSQTEAANRRLEIVTKQKREQY